MSSSSRRSVAKTAWNKLSTLWKRRERETTRRAFLFEPLESRNLLAGIVGEGEGTAPSLVSIPNQILLSGSPLWVSLDGSDVEGGQLTFTATSSNPGLVTATVAPATNKSVKFSVENFGDMKFMLFDHLVPGVTARIQQLINSGFYDKTTTSAVQFIRVLNDFVIQGGDPTNTGSGGSGIDFDDQFHVDLQHNRSGLLSMAKSSDDTNDSQFFITEERNESQFVTLNGNPTGGTFTLTYFDQTTVPITFNNSGNFTTMAAQIQTALSNLSRIGAGNVTVTHSPVIDPNTQQVTNNRRWKVDFVGALGHQEVINLTGNAAGLTGGTSPTISVVPQTSARFLDFNHSIFGVLTEGEAIRDAISNVQVQASASFGGEVSKPVTPVVISNVDVFSDLENSALMLKATEGASGEADITVTVSDQQGNSFQRTFHVLVGPDVINGGPFLNPIAPVRGVVGQPIQLQLTATDVENNPNFFDAFKPTGETNAYTFDVNETTGLVTITPPTGFMGNFNILVGVRGLSGTDTNDTFDTQLVQVTVGPAIPTVDLLAASDTGASNTDNITNDGTVDFQVSGVTAGATVKLLKGTTVLAQGTASGDSITFTNVQLSTLGEATHAITATQTVSGTESAPSTVVNVTYDITPPAAFTSTPPTTAQLGFNFNHNVQNPDEGATGFQYSLVTPPAGATINPTTGVITWTPTSAQAGTQNFSVTATDAAGNSRAQAFSVTVAAPVADLVLKLTTPSGGTLTTLAPGQDFLLKVFSQDLSTEAAGVFSAYLDITWDSTKAIVTGPIVYSANYPNAQSGTTTTAGLIDEAGAAAGLSELGAGQKEILSIPMRATASGSLVFSGDPADVTVHETTIFDPPTVLQPSQIHYGTVSINISNTLAAANDSFNVSRNSNQTTLNVLANDTMSATGQNLRVTAVGAGNSGGQISIGTNGANILYKPATNFAGTESFSYTITDQASGTPTAQGVVTVTVSGLVANNDTFTVIEDSSNNSLDPLNNDVKDQPTSTLTITAVNVNSNDGAVTRTNNNTLLSFTPAANKTGAVSFTYTINDGLGHDSTATITVNITNANDPPSAVNDSVTAFRNTPATFDLLANDTSGLDPTENLTIDTVTQPASGGTVSIIENGKKVSFTPTTDFQGATSFSYTIKDPGGLTSTATATVNVQPFAPSSLAGFVYFDADNNGVKGANELPIVGVSITLSSTLSGFTSRTVKTGDDGSYKFENLAPGTYTIKQDVQPAFTIDGKDTVGSQGGTASQVSGIDQFSITLTQGTTGTGNNFGEMGRQASTFTIRDFFSSRALNHTFTALNSNGVELWHTLDTPPWNGYTAATFALDTADSELQFSAKNPQSQTVTATVSTTSDKVALLGESSGNKLYRFFGGPISYGFTPGAPTTNQSPTAVGDTFAATKNTTLTVAAAGVLANDTDPESNPLTAVSATQPAHGTVTLNANGSFTYVPTTDFTGADSFTYRANDGNSSSAVATVTINVAATSSNTAPAGVPDSYSTAEDVSLVVPAAGVLANDTDVQGGTLTASVASGPAHGTLTLNSNGSFTYIPAANYSGPDSFVYRATDSGSLQSGPTTVSLTVTPVNDAPQVTDDVFLVTEDTPRIVGAPGVLANDSDAESNTLTATVVGQPQHGTIVLSANGSFTYTPNANFSGTDSFSYKVNDGQVDSATAVVTFTVNGENDPPVAVNDSFETNQDTSLTVGAPGILANDTDPDPNTTLTANLITGAGTTNGTLEFNSNGSFTYTPNPGFQGIDSFRYIAGDGTSSDEATVTITVNGPPVAANDSHATNEDVPLTISAPGILANDTDPDNDALTAVVVGQPASGNLTVGSNGSFTYTPAANASGTFSFTYRASDGALQSNLGTVAIAVNPVNDAPTAQNDSFTTGTGSPLTVTAPGILANDSDPEGSAITATLLGAGGPQHGSLNFNAGGGFTYTPDPGFNGIDSFTYGATDGTATGTATVLITVNAAPVANNDTYAIGEDATLTVPVASGVLNNDTDAESNTLTASVVTQPQNGTLTLNSNGSFTYIPVANFQGIDSFSYRANDGLSNSSAAIVSITVTDANDPPTAVDDSFTLNEDAVLTQNIPGVLANDTDPDPGTTLAATFVTGPLHGSLSLNSDGSFTYTPAANFHGVDSFSYKVTDGTAESGTAVVTLTVNPTNDAPVATGESFNTNEDTPLSILAPGVLDNDLDPDNDAITAQIVDLPSSGTLSLTDDGSFLYTPPANFHSTVSFSYRASDGTLLSNLATVTITVNTVNDVPVAGSDSYSMPINSALVLPAPGVLANDTDADGDALTAGVIGQPQNGTLTLNSTGAFTYIPNANFSGTDSFSYQASDNNAQSPVAVVTITVHATNDAPIAADNAYTATANTTLIIPPVASVLANDTDPDGDSLLASVVTGPANGTLTLNPNGTLTYVPATGFTGTDSFTYNATDGVLTDQATVTITVEPAAGGEGEPFVDLNDAALLSFLASLDPSDPLYGILQSSLGDWTSAVDAFMAGLT